jgi:hypothetical protein
MKKLIILILLLASFKASAQNNNLFEFNDVIKVDSASKDQLFDRAREWMSRNIESSKDAIDLVDKQEGKILSSIFIKTPLKGGMGQWTESGVSFKIAIYAKEGRYKYELNNFIHIDLNTHKYPDAGGNLNNKKPICGWMGMSNAHWDDIKDMTKEKVIKMLKSLEISMKQATNNQNNNW